MRACLSAVFVLSLFNFASSAPAEPLAPQGKWIVNFADAQCIASRNYGTDQDPLLLVLKAPALGDVLQIAVVRKGGLIAVPKQMDGAIVFDGQPPIGATLLEFSVKQENNRVVLVNLPRSSLAPMRAASAIRIRAGDAQHGIQRGSRIEELSAESADYSFKLTQIPALLEVLDRCAADLKKTWNVEDTKGAPTLVRQRPTGNLREVFTAGDYPEVAQSRAQEGAIKVAILVDEKGKVTDCTVIQTSGVASLDSQSCVIIMKRAQLHPAIGLDGKPTKGALIQTIVWALMG